VVPAGSDQVSRARPYSGARPGRPRVFAYGTVTRCGSTFQSIRLTRGFVTSRPAGRRIKTSPTTLARQRLPSITSHEFGLFPFRSPLLRESRFLSFPPGTKMFQFPGLPLPALFDSGGSTRALPRVGFPIRKSPDQRMVSSFPGLIAAAHVLHRLLAPRHPPCALRHLTRKNTFYCRYGVFKVRVGSSSGRGGRPREDPPAGRESRSTVSQNSTAWSQRSRSTSFQASPGHRTAKIAGHRTSPDAYRGKSPGIP
jgi:hypothetical protein